MTNHVKDLTDVERDVYDALLHHQFTGQTDTKDLARRVVRLATGRHPLTPKPGAMPRNVRNLARNLEGTYRQPTDRTEEPS